MRASLSTNPQQFLQIPGWGAVYQNSVIRDAASKQTFQRLNLAIRSRAEETLGQSFFALVPGFSSDLKSAESLEMVKEGLSVQEPSLVALETDPLVTYLMAAGATPQTAFEATTLQQTAAAEGNDALVQLLTQSQNYVRNPSTFNQSALETTLASSPELSELLGEIRNNTSTIHTAGVTVEVSGDSTLSSEKVNVVGDTTLSNERVNIPDSGAPIFPTVSQDPAESLLSPPRLYASTEFLDLPVSPDFMRDLEEFSRSPLYREETSAPVERMKGGSEAMLNAGNYGDQYVEEPESETPIAEFEESLDQHYGPGAYSSIFTPKSPTNATSSSPGSSSAIKTTASDGSGHTLPLQGSSSGQSTEVAATPQPSATDAGTTSKPAATQSPTTSNAKVADAKAPEPSQTTAPKASKEPIAATAPSPSPFTVSTPPSNTTNTSPDQTLSLLKSPSVAQQVNNETLAALSKASSSTPATPKASIFEKETTLENIVMLSSVEPGNGSLLSSGPSNFSLSSGVARDTLFGDNQAALSADKGLSDSLASSFSDQGASPGPVTPALTTPLQEDMAAADELLATINKTYNTNYKAFKEASFEEYTGVIASHAKFARFAEESAAELDARRFGNDTHLKQAREDRITREMLGNLDSLGRRYVRLLVKKNGSNYKPSPSEEQQIDEELAQLEKRIGDPKHISKFKSAAQDILKQSSPESQALAAAESSAAEEPTDKIEIRKAIVENSKLTISSQGDVITNFKVDAVAKSVGGEEVRKAENVTSCNETLARDLLSRPDLNEFTKQFELKLVQMSVWGQIDSVEDATNKQLKAGVGEAVFGSRAAKTQEDIRESFIWQTSVILKELSKQDPSLCSAKASRLTGPQLAKANKAMMGAGLSLLSNFGNINGQHIFTDSFDENGCLQLAPTAPRNRESYYKDAAFTLYGLWNKSTTLAINGRQSGCASEATAAERLACFSRLPSGNLSPMLDITHQLNNCSNANTSQLSAMALEYEKELRQKVAAKCPVAEAQLLSAPDAEDRLIKVRKTLEQRLLSLKASLGSDYQTMGVRLDHCQEDVAFYQTSAALQMQPKFRGGPLKLELEGFPDGHSKKTATGKTESQSQ